MLKCAIAGAVLFVLIFMVLRRKKCAKCGGYTEMQYHNDRVPAADGFGPHYGARMKVPVKVCHNCG